MNHEDMMNNAKIQLTPLIAALVLSWNAQQASARDFIHIVGSSTVAPFSKAVAEQLAKGGKKAPGLKAPWLESTGTKGGIQLFCEGRGEAHADIVNTARRMTRKEFDQCQSNGVGEIVEVAVGRDALAFAQSKNSPDMSLTRHDLYFALTRMVPDAKQKTVAPNAIKSWKQINAMFPDRTISLIGPPANSGMRELLRDTVLEAGCDGFPWLRTQNQSQNYKRACQDVRNDQAYLEAPVNDPTSVRELTVNQAAIGLMSFSFFTQHQDKLKALEVDGVTPKQETVASGSYPLSGPLYFYVKKSHLDTVPGLAKFIQEFTTEKAFGDKGYLVAKGLIPMPQVDRKVSADIVKTLAPIFSPPA